MLDIFIGFAILLATLFFIAGKKLKDFGVLLVAASILFGTGFLILDSGWETFSRGDFIIQDVNTSVDGCLSNSADCVLIQPIVITFPATLEENPIVFSFAYALIAAGIVLALHALSLGLQRKAINELSQDTED
ncbi:hypothetical protein LCGC14_1913040 [marine sediment metagenome]|uniref:Uncharacterized protein n=1 Tax=marine sediment metagenome TaxID=412755 RepID=A0A0F9GG87_9ZZZZ